MFVPIHIPHVPRTAKSGTAQSRNRDARPKAVLSAVAGVLITGLVSNLVALGSGSGGKAIGLGLALGLGCAALGLGVARAIGRQGKI